MSLDAPATAKDAKPATTDGADAAEENEEDKEVKPETAEEEKEDDDGLFSWNTLKKLGDATTTLTTLSGIAASTWAVGNAAVDFLTPDQAKGKIASDAVWAATTGWLPGVDIDLDYAGLAASAATKVGSAVTGAVDAVVNAGTDVVNAVTGAYDEYVPDWVDNWLDKAGKPADGTSYEGTDANGETSNEVVNGQLKHKSGDGTETTVEKGVVDARNMDKVFQQDTAAGTRSEEGEGWRMEGDMKKDGDVRFVRDDGGSMVIKYENGKPVEATLDRGDGSPPKTFRKGFLITQLPNGDTITQATAPPPDDPAAAADAQAEQEKPGTHATADGVVRVNTAGGTTIYAHSDGRKDIDLGDGVHLLVKEDGSSAFVKLDENGQPVAQDFSGMVDRLGGQVSEDGQYLTINGQKIALTGPNAGKVVTDDGKVIAAGSNQTTTFTDKDGDGKADDMDVVSADPATGSKLITGVCAEGVPGQCLNDDGSLAFNADGTPKMKPTEVSEVNPATGDWKVGGATVDPATGDITVKPEGEGVWSGKQLPGDKLEVDVPGADKPLVIGFGEDGFIENPNGSKWYDDHVQLWDGTNVYDDGRLDFSDGTSITADGNLFYDGDYLGNAFEQGDDSAVAAQAEGLVAAAQAEASRIGGLTPDNITPGDIGKLLAAFSALSGLKGALMAAGAIRALSAVDQAIGSVLGELPGAQTATDLQAKSTALVGGVSDDALNLLFKGAHGADFASINKVLTDAGYGPNKLSEVMHDISKQVSGVLPPDAAEALNKLTDGGNWLQVKPTVEKYVNQAFSPEEARAKMESFERIFGCNKPIAKAA